MSWIYTYFLFTQFIVCTFLTVKWIFFVINFCVCTSAYTSSFFHALIFRVRWNWRQIFVSFIVVVIFFLLLFVYSIRTTICICCLRIWQLKSTRALRSIVSSNLKSIQLRFSIFNLYLGHFTFFPFNLMNCKGKLLL